MSFEQFGIGAKFVFDSTQAITSMSRSSRALARMKGQVISTGRSVKALAPTFKRAFKIGAAVVATTLGAAVLTAASFEKQMSAVAAVSNANAEEMKLLTQQSKDLGATTAFTAKQAAEGQELLARAGFKTNEIMAGMPAVLNAAAAEGMDLATSADIIASTIRGFNMDASQASHVADVLAYASANSNTNMIQLGEGLKYAQAQFAGMGVGLEETVAMLAKISDAGIKASMSGTSLVNAFVKIIKPSKEGAKALDKWGVKLTDSQGKMRPMGDIIGEFSKGLDTVTDSAERSRLMTEVFGIRGQKALNALKTAGGAAINKFADNLVGATGYAQKMARTRLDNLAGDWTLFTSAMSGLMIEMGAPIADALRKPLQSITQFISGVVSVLQGGERAMKYSGTTIERVANNISRGLNIVRDSISGFGDFMKMTFMLIGPDIKLLQEALAHLFNSFDTGATGSQAAATGFVTALSLIVKSLTAITLAAAGVRDVFVAVGTAIGWVASKFVNLFKGETYINLWTKMNTAVKGFMLSLQQATTPVNLFLSVMTKIVGVVAGLVKNIPLIGTGINSLIQAFTNFVNSPYVQKAVGFISRLSGFSAPTVAPGGEAGTTTPPVRAPATAGIREVGLAKASAGQRPVRVELGGTQGATQKVVVESRLYLDGRELRQSVARQQVELGDRQGTRYSPGQRRQALELGKILAESPA